LRLGMVAGGIGILRLVGSCAFEHETGAIILRRHRQGVGGGSPATRVAGRETQTR